MSLIYEKKYPLKIAKLELSPKNFIALAQGKGLAYGELLAKSSDKYHLTSQHDSMLGAHDGLECRWNPIQSVMGTMMTLIVDANSIEVYQKVYDLIDQIIPQQYAASVLSLSVKWPPSNLMNELKVKHGFVKRLFIYPFLVLLIGLLTLLVKLKRKTPDSAVAQYLHQLCANTDFSKFDDKLRLVLDISELQKNRLLAFLDEQEAAALMTCFIKSQKEHLHFIDGGDGGYALAAKNLKQKLLKKSQK
jgi:hypothetical protein